MEIKSSSSEEKVKKKHTKSLSESSNEKSLYSNKSNDEEHLINYFTFINNSSTKLEENRQSYFNKLSELKSQFDSIKLKSLPSADYLMIIISDFITLCDTYYSSFAEQKKILTKFNELNDAAQNINFCYEKANYSNSYFKESNKKLTKQYEKIYKENQNLRQIFKEINLDQNKNINNIDNEIYEKNTAEKEMKNKMEKVIEENIELKKRCSQILSESKIIKNYADEKFLTERENNRKMSTLLNKLDVYEDTIDKMQKKITQYETERANTENNQKEYNDKNISVNIRYENENMINLDTNKSELSDNISIKQGFNLEELLLNQNEEEGEKMSKNIHISYNNEIKNFSEKNSDGSDSGKRFNNDYDIDAENEIGSNFLMLCPIKKLDKKKYKHERSKCIYKSPFSKSQISIKKINKNQSKNKNAKSVINGGGNNMSKNYNKIFFFLLLKSIIINRNIKEFFKNNDFDALFEEVQKARIPFNLYEDYIINKFHLNENANDNSKYMDSIINDCFICSSII